jgi:hypothetical protein
MRFFIRRRLVGAACVLAALAAVWMWTWHAETRLQPTSFVTGWLLAGAVGSLALFQLRKKLPAPPLGSASAWMQVHIYTGLATSGLFLLHAPLRWPGGGLEAALAVLYWATFASGVVGLYWTRSLPRRLSRVGQEVIFEQIASVRAGIRERAQAEALAAVRSTGATTLGQFYASHLQDYFSTRRDWRYRLAPSSRLRKSLAAELTAATRYFSDAERRSAETLFALVRQRDDLDYHEALQSRLKAWLFVHIALTYPLLAAAAVHGWTAHLFYGGVR